MCVNPLLFWCVAGCWVVLTPPTSFISGDRGTLGRGQEPHLRLFQRVCQAVPLRHGQEEITCVASSWCQSKCSKGRRHSCTLKVKVLVSQFCPTPCDSMDCSQPGSSVHGISQAGILEWGAMPSSRGSSYPLIELRSPVLQANSLRSELPWKPYTLTSF